MLYFLVGLYADFNLSAADFKSLACLLTLVDMIRGIGICTKHAHPYTYERYVYLCMLNVHISIYVRNYLWRCSICLWTYIFFIPTRSCIHLHTSTYSLSLSLSLHARVRTCARASNLHIYLCNRLAIGCLIAGMFPGSFVCLCASMSSSVCVCMYVCMYVCMHACICACACACAYAYIYTFLENGTRRRPCFSSILRISRGFYKFFDLCPITTTKRKLQ